jgi:hypothetical protein
MGHLLILGKKGFSDGIMVGFQGTEECTVGRGAGRNMQIQLYPLFYVWPFMNIFVRVVQCVAVRAG